jgi:hypothetical protein
MQAGSITATEEAMPDEPTRETLGDWNGRQIPVARTRGGVIVVLDPSDNLVRGGVVPWPPPEVVQKAYQSRQVRAFDAVTSGRATSKWGFYSDLQSLHSEDAITWSVFGPLVYSEPSTRSRFVAALLKLLELHVRQEEPAHVWLWRRIPHPDTIVSGGPEIDVGIHVGDTIVYGEAKWRSIVGRQQGKAGDKDQIQLRREFCQTVGQKLYPEARRFIVLGIAQDASLVQNGDTRCGNVDVYLRSLSWNQLVSVEEHPHQAELRRYLAWKSEHSQSRGSDDERGSEHEITGRPPRPPSRLSEIERPKVFRSDGMTSGAPRSRITVEAFRRGAADLSDDVIETLYQRREFTVRVLPDDRGLEYTPRSTGKRREQRWTYIERVLERFNETGSLHAGDYADLTKHASYVLAIVKRIRSSQ